jgi:hypothetical protein
LAALCPEESANTATNKVSWARTGLPDVWVKTRVAIEHVPGAKGPEEP